MPMVPPAPPELSTTTCCLSELVSVTPRLRASVSVGPPAANGTMTVIDLFG
jgi:hypothetical protein